MRSLFLLSSCLLVTCALPFLIRLRTSFFLPTVASYLFFISFHRIFYHSSPSYPSTSFFVYTPLSCSSIICFDYTFHHTIPSTTLFVHTPLCDLRSYFSSNNLLSYLSLRPSSTIVFTHRSVSSIFSIFSILVHHADVGTRATRSRPWLQVTRPQSNPTPKSSLPAKTIPGRLQYHLEKARRIGEERRALSQKSTEIRASVSTYPNTFFLHFFPSLPYLVDSSNRSYIWLTQF